MDKVDMACRLGGKYVRRGGVRMVDLHECIQIDTQAVGCHMAEGVEEPGRK